MMNEILRNLINKGKVAAFVDDVLVETETEEGYDEVVEEILRRLEENDLYIKPEKCAWKVRKIGFLGVVIGPNGIEMEEGKVDGVLSWPEPKNVKDVRKFLGLANYYRRFIKDFTRVARPINMLMRKVLSLSLDDSRTTQCECLGRTQWSSLLDWTTYLYYFYK